jgi:hypothetical protein
MTGSTHEIYPYSIIDGSAAAIKTPLGTFVLSYDEDGVITSPSMLSSSKGKCKPANYHVTPATDLVHHLYPKNESNNHAKYPVDPRLLDAWESVYSAAYGSNPIHEKRVKSYNPNVKRSYDSIEYYGWTGKRAGATPNGISLYENLEVLRSKTTEIADAACKWLQWSDEKSIIIGASGNNWFNGSTGGMRINFDTCKAPPKWIVTGDRK